MTQNAESSALPGPVEKKRPRFTWKHAVTLIFAVAITVGAFVFQDAIAQLRELGYVGIFLIMLISSATVFAPAPGLLIEFLMAPSFQPILFGLAAGAGSTLGEISGFIAGYSGSGIVENAKVYQRIEGWVKRYGVIPIVVLAAIPNPLFDAAGLAAGALGMAWWRFFGATLLGKTIKTIIVAYAGFYGISWIKTLIVQ
jgi:uncharacterized membrane protein YdjX (TVP38/TMEM64 family)